MYQYYEGDQPLEIIQLLNRVRSISIMLLVMAISGLLIPAHLGFAQTLCSSQIGTDSDRRESSNQLTIFRQFGFGESHPLDMLSEDEPDIAILEDVASCEALLVLLAELNESEYKAYLIDILGAEKKLGLLTKIDLDPTFELQGPLIEDRYELDCGPLYLFNFRLNGINITVAGVYYFSNLDLEEKCTMSMLRGANIGNTFDMTARANNSELILLSDLNDYFGDDPIEVQEIRGSSWDTQTLVESYTEDGIAMTTANGEVQLENELDEYLTPVMFSKHLAPAVHSIERDFNLVEPPTESNETFRGEVESLVITLEVSKIERPFNFVWLIPILLIIAVTAFFILRNRGTSPAEPT